jgi:hypothetical protein
MGSVLLELLKHRLSASLLVSVLLLGLAGSSRPTAAETCPPVAGGGAGLAEQDAEVRLEFIRAEIGRESARAQRWTTAWQLSFGLVTGAQLALIPFFDDEDMRIELAVGAGKSAIGLAGLLVMPLVVNRAPRALEGWSGSETLGRCALLAQAEGLLLDAAESEAAGRSWLMHGANVLLNVGAGVALGWGLDRWQTAAINASAGLAVGALMILTQPDALEDVLARYRGGDLADEEPSPEASFFVAPTYTPSGAGLQLSIVF